MVENDHVSSALMDYSHFASRVGPAVHRNEKLGRVLRETAFDS